MSHANDSSHHGAGGHGHHGANPYPWGPRDRCPPGLILPILDERLMNPTLVAILYFLNLLYYFIGTAIVTQIFMTAIDRITSHTRKVYLAQYRAKQDSSLDPDLKEDEPEIIEVRVWNDTVANLILMAFGTASPEIILSIIEIVAHNFESPQLGPATIVGSAAFNLCIITSICMLALPTNQVKRLCRIQVFIVTGLFSFFAYIWLMLILRVISPDIVELWEASITFIMFPILILFAYAADREYFGLLKKSSTKNQMELSTLNGTGGTTHLDKELLKDGQVDKDTLLKFVKETKKFPGLTDQEIALLAASKLVDCTSHSSNWHRIGGVRGFSASRRVKPVLNAKLQEVYDIIKEHPDGLELGDVLKDAETETVAVVEFHSPSVAVRESVGSFAISVLRTGNLQSSVRVRVESIDGSAKQGEDYEKVKELLVFGPYEQEKKVTVKIIDDSKWEPEEEFFLRLTLLNRKGDSVKLGQYQIMEVTIVDDDDPGILAFEKRGLVVKESAGSITVPVVRCRGTDGEVSMKWRTVDQSAISGRDYKGGEGVVTFKDNEMRQTIVIPIIDDMDPEKDEYFEVVLSDPTGGAKIGNINRILITISNDDDFNSVVHRLMALTNANLDAIKVHSETWSEQFKLAMSVNGGDTESATTCDYIMHFVSFYWKILFAFVPPPAIFGGWPCLVVSLCVIGLLTTVIQDLAIRLGCMLDLNSTINAITLVAMGTTLPDILGARMVTREEHHADGALIHITGSIAVNVLIGVGIPWFVAAAYHSRKGTYFVVESEYGFEFSVLMFSIAAVLAVTLLMIRRKLHQFGAAELGGPDKGRYFTVAVLVSLWILYLVLSILWVKGYIGFKL